MSRFFDLLGIERRHPTWRERLLSGLGGAVAIALILWVSRAVVGDGAGLIVASMGASAVLLFAVPHGPLSQPWQLLAGHLVSALIGVACARGIADPLLAATLAVGLAIFAMRLLGCVHPPGGATALSAVVGGPAVAALGFQYVLTPVLLNALVILIVAVAFNYPFAWRRYPAALHQQSSRPVEAAAPVNHADLVYALSEMDTFVDIDEQDLQRIYDVAVQHAESAHLPPELVHEHRYYSNGRYGADWQVREVTRLAASGADGQPVVTFRVVAGQSRNQSGRASLLEFARWAKYPVQRTGKTWQRLTPPVA